MILAIDCSTPPSDIALLDDEEIIAEREGPFGRDTDAWIMAAVDEMMREARLGIGHLNAIAVTVGPGAFTGIRVGIATALGLSLGRACPTLGVSTLAAMAEAARTDHSGHSTVSQLLPCIDARRGQLYAAVYEQAAPLEIDTAPLWGPAAVKPQELVDHLLSNGIDKALLACGSGTSLLQLRQGWSVASSALSTAAATGRIAARRLRRPDPPSQPITPLYVRAPDAHKARPPGQS